MSKVKINSLSKSVSTKIKIKYSEIVGETGYKIYRKTSKSSWSLVTTRKTKYSNTWTNSNRKKGTRYYYRVRAFKTVNGKNIYAPYSTTKSIKR